MVSTAIIGIDPGDKTSGVVVITEKGIREGYNIPNTALFDFVMAESKLHVRTRLILEDIKPYNVRITDQLIQTIKFLGAMEYTFSSLGIRYDLVPRWKVKKWVFDNYPSIVLPEIDKKIERTNRRKVKNGQPEKKKRPASFLYVDDRMVANAMRRYWEIKNPTKVGQKAEYNLKDHSWQALSLVTHEIATTGHLIC